MYHRFAVALAFTVRWCVGQKIPTQRAVCYTPFHLSSYSTGNVAQISADIDADFKAMANTVSIVRTYYAQHYGIQVAAIAAKYNIQLYLGVYMTSESWARDEINAAVQAVKNYPSTVLGLIFGNENLINSRLNFGSSSADDILALATSTRNTILSQTGRWVPIGTSQRITEWLDSSIQDQTKKLANGVCSWWTSEGFCGRWIYYPLDILGTNIYPFFDSNYNSNQPVALLDSQWNCMIAQYGVAKVRLTESGFPSAGNPPWIAPKNWPSLSGEANYYSAMNQWRPSNGGGPLFWFTAFDLPASVSVPADYERYVNAMAFTHRELVIRYFGLFNVDRSWKSGSFPWWNQRETVGIQYTLFTKTGAVLSEWNQGVYADTRRCNHNEQ